MPINALARLFIGRAQVSLIHGAYFDMDTFWPRACLLIIVIIMINLLLAALFKFYQSNMKFIVKLFPEITIKSRSVKKRLVRRLHANLQIILQRIDPQIKVTRLWDRVLIEQPKANSNCYEDLVAALGNVQGIAHVVQVQEYPLTTPEALLETVIKVWGDALAGKSFVVRVKRSGEHDFSSVEMERYIGKGILESTQALKVNLHQPQMSVKIEIKDNAVFLVERRIDGIGGYPQGSQEPVLSLISGGFDSIVASYLAMKRGSKTHFLFFNLGGPAHEKGVKQAAYFLWNKYASAAKVKFISVPFDEVVGELMQQVSHSHRGVVLKRMMLKVADRVAAKLKAEALITGESIAQVSSQTLTNLSVIDRATQRLVLRPLVTFDKQEIIDIAERIGAYELAATMPEYCGIISDKPTVRAQLSQVEAQEQNFDMNLLEKALEGTVEYSIECLAEGFVEAAPTSALNPQKRLDNNQVVIDIREPFEQQKKPLNLPGVKILTVPFYEINKHFESLDPSQHYLLYCEKGVMSQLHALHIQDQGFKNVDVYRPE